MQPYITATQSGITQVAYHFDTPMIVTNVGGLPEMVSDQKEGFICEVNSKSVANAILELYNEPGTIQRMSDHVKHRKNDFSWKNFIHKMNDGILFVK